MITLTGLLVYEVVFKEEQLLVMVKAMSQLCKLWINIQGYLPDIWPSRR